MGGSKRKQLSNRIYNNKKAKFRGNRYTKIPSSETKTLSFVESATHSAPSKKLNIADRDFQDFQSTDFNFVMNFSLLENVISLLKCPNLCDDNVYLMFDSSKKYGLSIGLKICCNSCNWKTEFFSSATFCKNNFIEQEPSKSKCSGQKPFDINTRVIVAFREMGKGLSSLEKFCGIMNMKPPMNKKSYNKTLHNLLDVYQNLVDQNMKNAADELIPAGETSRDIMCSFDGSWQKRGFTSNNGVVSAISVESGKCIDFQIETKTCKLCSIWKLKKSTYPVEYEKFQSSHYQKCKISHTGSSSAMESSGVLKLFRRSEKKNNLRYTTYLGDGDSSSYASVVAAKPYGHNVEIKKAECIGHIQKRVGTRLRNLKKSSKKILSDGKKLGGAGRLTENVINTLQNYYGKAIRQNIGNLYAMKKSVAAVLFHCSESYDSETRHQFCLRTKDLGANSRLIK